MGRKYRVISADGHVEMPPEAWVRHVPEPWRERAPRLPSEYLLDHVYFGIIREHVALRLGEFIPLDRLMWGSDFPHSVGSFPESRKFLDEAFAPLDAYVRRRILLENPARFFGLDLAADIAETPR